jgi:hypothetical protein
MRKVLSHSVAIYFCQQLGLSPLRFRGRTQAGQVSGDGRHRCYDFGRTRLQARRPRRNTETARRELASLASWRESLQTLERDKELLLQSYATRALEALANLEPEERRTVYCVLGLCVEALPGKSIRVRGAFGEESLVCHHDRTSTR